MMTISESLESLLGCQDCSPDDVWEKGTFVSGTEMNEIRKDVCGALMKKGLHGTESDMGWEIDHIVPESKGGGSTLSNLQPLQWRNNRHKSDKFPWDHRDCAVTDK